MGMTNNPVRRVWKHKQGLVEGFTQRYNVHKARLFGAFRAPG